MKFTVIVERGEESGYVVHCPELKGCWSQGSTISEALERITEAIAGCLEARDECAEQSVLSLDGASPSWVKASHQPNTNSHI